MTPPPEDDQLPPSTWLTKRTRSVGLRQPSSSFRGASSDGTGCGGARVGGVLQDMNVAQLAANGDAQAPQMEKRSGGCAEGLDEGGLGVAIEAGGPVEKVEISMRQMPIRNVALTTALSSSGLDEGGAICWQTVPVLEASILHEVHKTHLATTKSLDLKDDDNAAQPSSLHTHQTEKPPFPEPHIPESHFQLPEVASPILQSDHGAPPGDPSHQRVRFKGIRELANLQGVKKRGRSPGRRTDPPPATPNASSLLKQVIGKPDYKTLGKLILSQDCNITDMDRPESEFTRPPHPYDVGKVHQVNICPVCERYTVSELDRPADSDQDREALRVRFECSLCGEWFDMGITLFDPRGTPGVTLYQGEDRFRPPVPPRSTYPCTRCWMNTDTSFKCMVLYLRDETRVKCEPECPAARLNAGSQQVEKRSLALNQKKYNLRKSRSGSDVPRK